MQILGIDAPKLTDDEFKNAYYFLHEFIIAFEYHYSPQVKRWRKKYRNLHPFESQFNEYKKLFITWESDQKNPCESNDDEPF